MATAVSRAVGGLGETSDRAYQPGSIPGAFEAGIAADFEGGPAVEQFDGCPDRCFEVAGAKRQFEAAALEAGGFLDVIGERLEVFNRDPEHVRQLVIEDHAAFGRLPPGEFDDHLDGSQGGADLVRESAERLTPEEFRLFRRTGWRNGSRLHPLTVWAIRKPGNQGFP